MGNKKLKLNFEQYKDSVYACWIGKNIGGTMGTPYEGKRQMFNIQGFATEANVPLPNDDLDLQLVWLYALESLGPNAIDAAALGEYWISFIVPNWNEYGISKNNMRRGLIPPISGDYENNWKDSNGAWIRTEIWACLAPGCPDIAAKYAVEDGKVDHGAGEGTFAAAFVAAMQSAAFVVKNLRKCIQIALAEIPENCRVADSVRFVLDCYDRKMTPIETRNAVLTRNSDIGDGWFEAPSNVAYAILGLLYGEGDFKRSMILAINCGDDTDCTGATVGSTMGILYGVEGVPVDWRMHVGDEIITKSFDTIVLNRKVPHSCTELTERVVKQSPNVLLSNHADVVFTEEKTSYLAEDAEFILTNCKFRSILDELKPFAMHFDSVFAEVDAYLESAPDILPGEQKRVTLAIRSKGLGFNESAYNLSMRWWLPEGFSVVSGRKTVILPRKDPHSDHCCKTEFMIQAGESVSVENRCVLEICASGRFKPMYIPILFLG